MWSPNQQAFHPATLGCILMLCGSAVLPTIVLQGKQLAAASIALCLGAGMFRIFVPVLWAIFIRQARGSEVRPSGKTPRIRSLLGHLCIQVMACVGIVLTCALIWINADTRRLMHTLSAVRHPWARRGESSLTMQSISAAYSAQDGCTDTWMWTTRIGGAIRRWWKGAAMSSDGSELLSRRAGRVDAE